MFRNLQLKWHRHDLRKMTTCCVWSTVARSSADRHHRKKEKFWDRETERKKEETKRKRKRKFGREKDKKKERERERETGENKLKKTEHPEREREREREVMLDREIAQEGTLWSLSQAEKVKQTETNRKRTKGRESEKERETERAREKERWIKSDSVFSKDALLSHKRERKRTGIPLNPCLVGRGVVPTARLISKAHRVTSETQ